MQMIGLMPEEIDALDYLVKNGTNVVLNPTFTTPNYTWQDAKKKI